MTRRELASAWRRTYGAIPVPVDYRVYLTRGALVGVQRGWQVEVYVAAKRIASVWVSGSREYDAAIEAVVAIRNHQQRVAA